MLGERRVAGQNEKRKAAGQKIMVVGQKDMVSQGPN